MMNDVMAKAAAALLVLLVAACPAATIEQNVQALEQAARAIEAAIQAKGKTPTGGLNAAADDILALPDKINYDHDYVAHTNTTIEFSKFETNVLVHTGYQLLPYLVANGNQYFRLTDVGVNQDSYVEMKLTDLDTTGDVQLFGTRSSNQYGMMISGNAFCFPYYNALNQTSVAATPDAVLCIDANNFYVDGELVMTAAKQTFTAGDYVILLDMRGATAKTVDGKFYWCDIRRAFTASAAASRADMYLLPALDPNGTACVVDVKSNPNSPTKYYNSTGSAWPAQPPPTNEWIYVETSGTNYVNQVPAFYQTNVVGSADNKLIINDAQQAIYGRISTLTK